MSWTPSMTREWYTDAEKIKLFRHSTKRWISVVLDGSDDPDQIICRVPLQYGEKLETTDGVVIIARGYDGFSHNWPYKPISFEVVEASTGLEPVLTG